MSMNAHSRRSGSSRGHRSVWIVSLVVVVIALAAVGTTLALRHSPSRTAAGATGATSTTAAPAEALSIDSTTPASGAVNVPSDIAITVHLSAPLSASSPMPTLNPAVAGTW